jgi:3-hydroxyisobutyrate dehydrogenase-like beta-hydroxyacid dehydrogenase
VRPAKTIRRRDPGIIHDEVRRCSVPILFGALAEQRFREAQARGLGEDDMAGLVRLLGETSCVRVGEG